MPAISSVYNPKRLFKNGHFSTIYSAKFRSKILLKQNRERIPLKDGDFMDIDWSYAKKPTNKVVILLHGLEGNSLRPYMKGASLLLNNNDWDAVSVNFRGCSGDDNLLFRTYNAGVIDDLHEVIEHIINLNTYTEIALNGFSLGGNLIINYLGGHPNIPKEVTKAIVISATLDLKGTLYKLNQSNNILYRTVFLKSLRNKYRKKVMSFPNLASKAALKRIKSLLEFDTIYTAPAHGYKDAWDYYEKCSGFQYLEKITTPTYILNAQNDTFLSSNSFPKELAKNSKFIHLETPKYGGHVGFYQPGRFYYSEIRMLAFLEGNL